MQRAQQADQFRYAQQQQQHQPSQSYLSPRKSDASDSQHSHSPRPFFPTPAAIVTSHRCDSPDQSHPSEQTDLTDQPSGGAIHLPQAHPAEPAEAPQTPDPN